MGAKQHNQVFVKIGDRGFTTEIKAGNHTFTADEPEDSGGNDKGPDPYDLLLASLGSCTAMTLRMYTDRKKWDVDEIHVSLKHSKVHSDDCEDCDKSNAKIDKLDRSIEVKGTLDESQISRLLEIADKCPVHKTLTGDIRIESNLKLVE